MLKNSGFGIEGKSNWLFHFCSILLRSSAMASLFGVRFPLRYFRYVGSGMSKSLAAVFAFRFPRHKLSSLLNNIDPMYFNQVCLSTVFVQWLLSEESASA
jgi:hypothetical protein